MWIDHIDLTRDEEYLQTFTANSWMRSYINRSGNETILQVSRKSRELPKRPATEPQSSPDPNVFTLGFQHIKLS